MYLESLLHNNKYESDLRTIEAFNKIAKLSPYIIYVQKASDQSLLYINRRVTEILGYTEEDIISMGGNMLSAIINPEDVDFVVNLKDIHTKDNEIQEFKTWMRHKNGDRMIFKTRTMVFKTDDNGNAEEIVGIAEDITLEHNAIEKATHNEALLAEAEQMMDFGSWEWDTLNENLIWSEGLYKIFGYQDKNDRPEKLSFDFYQSHIVSDETGLSKYNYDFLKEGNEIMDYDRTIIAKDGKRKFLKGRTKVFKNEEGKVLKVIGCIMDYTLSKSSTELLIKNETLLSETEKSMNYGSWDWNVITNEVIWSDGLWKIFGYDSIAPENRVVKVDFFMNHIHPNDLEYIQMSFEKFLETGFNNDLDYRIINKQGQVRILNGKSKIIEGTPGNPIRVIGSTADVTELRFNTQKLIESETLLSEAEKMLLYGSWSWDLSDDKVFWSDGLWKIFGYEPNSFEINFETFLSLIDKRDVEEVKKIITNSFEKSISYDLEHRVIRPDGAERIFLAKGMPVFNNEGKVIKLMGSTADVTELRKTRNELENKIQALNRSNTELEQFAYIASHDLQEPLRKISSFGERLQTKYKTQLGDDGKLYIDRMVGATSRMKLLIENLLNFSRVTKLNNDFVKTDLDIIFKGVLSDLEIKIEEKNAKINYTPLPTIDAIPSQISQLFMNLLTNALKFGKSKELLIINIICEKVSHEVKKELLLESTKEYFKIIIQDNGIGFEQEYAERIFIIFQRLQGRSEEGSGIGLAICKKIIENHLGKIYAESKVGERTDFIMILPATQIPFKYQNLNIN